MGVISLWCVVVFVGVCSAIDVNTKYGIVRGQSVELHTGARVNTFLSIPYAKPPNGTLRFQNPQEPNPWGTYVANKYGHMCPQDGGIFDLTHPGFDDFDEDCLHLNIYSPNNHATPGPYPVMIWFHGGGYQAGGNIQYPGHFLSAEGVVVVIANYRVGILGFLTTGDSVVRGNMGMHDQVQVLRFVNENIRGFNGDPSKVTLFGQSAGGSSSGLHIVSPLSAGLFHQAISQSGTDLAPWANTDPDQHPENFAKDVAGQLNCTTKTNQAMVDCLRSKNATTLIKTAPAPMLGWIAQGFIPVVDGDGGFLPDRPITLREQGKFSKVKVISGQTTEDGSPYLLVLVPEAEDGGFNRTDFSDAMRRMVDLATFTMEEYRTEQVYQACMFQYTPWPHINDLELNRQQLVQIVTDVGFGFSTDAQLKSQSQDNDAYMYIIGFRSTNFTEYVPEWMGVPHNGELPYVFGYPYLQWNQAVRDETRIHFDIIDWNHEDRNMTNFVLPMWANFVKTGNPTPKPVKGPFDNPPQTWTKFTEQNQTFMYIGRKSEQLENYRSKYYAFFQSYMAWMLSHALPNGTTSSNRPHHKSKKQPLHNFADMNKKVQNFWRRRVEKSLPHKDMKAQKSEKELLQNKEEFRKRFQEKIVNEIRKRYNKF